MWMILLGHPYIYMQPLGNTFLYNVSILDLLKSELQSHRPQVMDGNGGKWCQIKILLP